MTGRQLSTARTAWGALLVFAPAVPLHALTGGSEPAGGPSLLRVLGARHVLQAALTLAAPTPWTLRLGAVADALHCASGLAFAAIDDRERRAALLDASIAAAWAAASVLAVPR
jgi:hypothetical protein